MEAIRKQENQRSAWREPTDHVCDKPRDQKRVIELIEFVASDLSDSGFQE